MGVTQARGSRIRRVALICLSLIAAGAVIFAAYAALAPTLSAGSVTLYDSYVVERGDIVTYRSFSGTMAVRRSETHSYTGGLGAEVSVLKLYVSDEQPVKVNDKLLLLDNGELYRAGIDGVVNEVRVEEGDLLWPNTTMIQLCNLTDLQVTLRVDEYDIEDVSIGESCVIDVLAPDLSFDAQITRINRVSASAGSVAYYTVTADLTVPEEVLPGMSATVTIPADEARGVLTLPMAALAFDDEKKPFVLVKNAEGGYDRAAVETGLSDGMTVEIKGGLSEGTTVYAEAGAESIAPAFSATELYKRIVGETVIVNDRAERGTRGGFGAGAGLSAGEAQPPDMPNGLSEDDTGGDTTQRAPSGAGGIVPQGAGKQPAATDGEADGSDSASGGDTAQRTPSGAGGIVPQGAGKQPTATDGEADGSDSASGGDTAQRAPSGESVNVPQGAGKQPTATDGEADGSDSASGGDTTQRAPSSESKSAGWQSKDYGGEPTPTEGATEDDTD